MSHPNLAGDAARGAFLTVTAQALRMLIQVLSVVVLSRLLTPRDYGLLAIVLIIMAFGEIFRDFGLTSASVQAPTLSRGQRDNLFWINTGIGAFLGALMFLLSGVIALVVREPVIAQMSQMLAAVFLLNGIATQYRATLMRELRFRVLAIVDISSAAIALAAGITAAIAGWQYWALVTQQLVMGTAAMFGVVIASLWIPRLPSRAHSVHKILRFGWNLVATNLVTYLGSQIDTILVGLRFGVAPLGLYNRAYQLVMTPLGQIRSPLTTVALPVLSRIQHDSRRFSSYVIAAQLGLGYGLGLPLALAIGLSRDVVSVFLGPQWAEAAPIIALFAIAGLMQTLAFVGYWIYLSRGLGPQLFRFTLVTTAIKVVCIVIGSFGGLIGVAIGFAVAPTISWPLTFFWLSRLTQIPTRTLYLGAFRILSLVAVVSAGSYGSGLLTTELNSAASLAIGVLVAAAFSALALLTRMYRTDFKQLVGFGRLLLRSHGGRKSV